MGKGIIKMNQDSIKVGDKNDVALLNFLYIMVDSVPLRREKE
jgi:hypothetical protein